MSQCAPNIDDTNGTCFTYDQLKNIAKKFNESNKLNRIPISKSKSTLLSKINSKMKKECSEEMCWTKDQEILKSRFRPKKPQSWNLNPAEWLSNFDIEKVMDQYQAKYKKFNFIGVFPNNYDHKVYMNTCVAEELCNLNIHDLIKNGTTDLGIVFNTDPHYLPGAHWVAVYVCLQKSSSKFGFYYYDSAADKPSQYIEKLYNSIKAQFKSAKLKKEFNIRINHIQHQYGDSECGMFSMNFIINMLKRNNTFDKVINDKITDEYVFRLREKYFN